jgi:hypothetical protein
VIFVLGMCRSGNNDTEGTPSGQALNALMEHTMTRIVSATGIDRNDVHWCFIDPRWYCIKANGHCYDFYVSETHKAIVTMDKGLEAVDGICPLATKGIYSVGGGPSNRVLHNWKRHSRYAGKDNVIVDDDGAHLVLLKRFYRLKHYPTVELQAQFVSMCYLGFCWAIASQLQQGPTAFNDWTFVNELFSDFRNDASLPFLVRLGSGAADMDAANRDCRRVGTWRDRSTVIKQRIPQVTRGWGTYCITQKLSEIGNFDVITHFCVTCTDEIRANPSLLTRRGMIVVSAKNDNERRHRYGPKNNETTHQDKSSMVPIGLQRRCCEIPDSIFGANTMTSY